MQYRIQFRNGVYRVQEKPEIKFFWGWLQYLYNLIQGGEAHDWFLRGKYTSYEESHRILTMLKVDDSYNSKPWITVYDENGVHFSEVL